MEFSNGVALTFDCGMWAEFRNELEILGSNGRIVLKNAFLGDQSYDIIKDGQTEKSKMKTLIHIHCRLIVLQIAFLTENL